MPKVGNKNYPYTAEGIAEAKAAAAESGEKMDLAPGGSYDAGGRVKKMPGYYGGGLVTQYMGGYYHGGKVKKEKK